MIYCPLKSKGRICIFRLNKVIAARYHKNNLFICILNKKVETENITVHISNLREIDVWFFKY